MFSFWGGRVRLDGSGARATDARATRRRIRDRPSAAQTLPFVALGADGNVKGMRRPVTEDFLRGTAAVHYRMASRLRDILLIPAPDQDKTDAKAHGPHAKNQSHQPKVSRWQLPSNKVLLLIASVILIPPAYMHIASRFDGPKGTVEFRCIHRCRLGGLVCLPGGMWQDSFRVGANAIEVWNPNVAGNWEAIEFEVRKNEHLVVECRPPKN